LASSSVMISFALYLGRGKGGGSAAKALQSMENGAMVCHCGAHHIPSLRRR
jgi:hypothetical protein